MARLKKPTLGKVSGRAGNAVGRDFGYDNFLSVRPGKYKMKKDFKEVSHKIHFHAAMKIAKTVISYRELKEIWDNPKLPGKRGYNRIISANTKLLKDDMPSVENIITPEGRGFQFDLLILNKNSIKCSFGMAGFIKPPFKFIFMFMFFDPKETEKDLNEILASFYFVTPQSADKIKSSVEPGKYNINAHFEDRFEFNRKRFQNVILYAAVVGTPTVKGKAWWTNTVAVDITDMQISNNKGDL